MDVAEVADLLEDPAFRDEHANKFSDIDLVAGGPPCQGFSLAGRRHGADKRNTLVWQFFRIVKVLKPRLVLIENVEGMTRKFSARDTHSPIKRIIDEVAALGYDVQPVLLNARNYGVPQNRSRIFIIGRRTRDGSDGLAAHEMLSRENSHQIRAKSRLQVLPPEEKLEVSVRDAIADLRTDGSVRGRKPSEYVLGLNKSVKGIGVLTHRESGGALHNHEFRKHSRKTEARFRFIQLLEGHGISRDVLYWSGMGQEDNLRQEVAGHGAWRWRELAKVCCSDERFADYLPSSSESIFELFSPLVNAFSSKKHSQRVLRQKSVSFTVMTIPDDYIHYCEPRVLTVREQARLQSFPDAFEFIGRVTTGGARRKIMVPQYTQVGNAVPPLLAKAIGHHLVALLSEMRTNHFWEKQVIE